MYITSYRSSSNLISVHWFFSNLEPLDLEKYNKKIVNFPHFFSLYLQTLDIWYIALQVTYLVLVKFYIVSLWKYEITLIIYLIVFHKIRSILSLPRADNSSEKPQVKKWKE
jgi:hypothetical protein